MTTQINPKANDRVWNLAGDCFAEALVMNGDEDVIEASRGVDGPEHPGGRAAHVLVPQRKAPADRLIEPLLLRGRTGTRGSAGMDDQRQRRDPCRIS